MNKGNVVLGVLAGVAVGAILGVLFAPDKGSETRKKIAEKASEGAEDLKGKFNDLVASISEKLEEYQEDAEEVRKTPENLKSEV